MQFSTVSLLCVAAAATFSASTAMAQATFSEANLPFETIAEGAEPSANHKAGEALRKRVAAGEFDTRGTEVAVPNAELEGGLYGAQPMIADSDLLWHNPFGSVFRSPISSRWYQKHGNTQVFRVFPGDSNLTSPRAGAARSEAFGGNDLQTVDADGMQLTFTGRFRVAEHNGSCRVMLFQSKGKGLNTRHETSGTSKYPAWGVALFVETDGKITLVERAIEWGERTVIDTGKRVGDSFDLRVVDNGLNYQAFIDNQLMAEGSWDRGDTPTAARWGAYVQGGDAGILKGSMDSPHVTFVSGAQLRLDPEGTDTAPVIASTFPATETN